MSDADAAVHDMTQMFLRAVRCRAACPVYGAGIAPA